MMKLINLCNKLIEYSFYSLFFLVPLVLTGDTFELFEFNKLWLTFGLTIIIASAWFTKMIVEKEIRIQRTPLDIPILLFLASQIISTIFSLDIHVSLWGYYSRFNGGLLSITAYIFLYYAFVSNLSHLGNLIVYRFLKISLISGIIVALWGLPSHFGYDPTCFMLRSTLDVSCWTESFQPKIRMFSTLGQPDWLAAYLVILIPLSIAMSINHFKPQNKIDKKNYKLGIMNYGKKKLLLASCFLILTSLFYIDLLYTDARSGFLAFWTANIFFWFFIFIKKLLPGKIFIRYFLIFNFIFLIFNFLIGTPISQLDKLTFSNLQKQLSSQTKSQAPNSGKTNNEKTITAKKTAGGTESGQIRMIVWKGALDVFKNYPFFGSGVETFAFSYYKYRLPEHNLVSEWDYLYNKAHNEYLNYLATTGIFGLGTYLLMTGGFLFIFLKKLDSNTKYRILTLALVASYLSILVSNFFGFSVVIVNIYLFLIPAFVFILQGMINPKKVFLFQKINKELRIRNHELSVSAKQWIFITLVILTSCFLILNLFRFWEADKAYAFGSNLNKTGQYQQAYTKLHEAIAQRGDEPVFKDELSFNAAILSVAFAAQKEASLSAEFLKETINLSNEVTSRYPNNVVFWKTRVRTFYALSQMDQKYLPLSLEAVKKANELAPTDAKISYNLGLLYQQNGDTKKAIEVLENTIKLKPDYKDAYYALGIYYHDLAKNQNGTIVNYDYSKKAVKTLKFILINIAPDDGLTKEALKNWGEL